MIRRNEWDKHSLYIRTACLTKRQSVCYNLTNKQEKDEDDGSSFDKV